MTHPNDSATSEASATDPSDAAFSVSELDLRSLPSAVSKSAAKTTVEAQLKDLGFPDPGSAGGGGDKTTAGLLSAFGLGEPGSSTDGVDNTTAGLSGFDLGAPASPQSESGAVPKGQNFTGLESHLGAPSESIARDVLQHHGQQVSDVNDTGKVLTGDKISDGFVIGETIYTPDQTVPKGAIVRDSNGMLYVSTTDGRDKGLTPVKSGPVKGGYDSPNDPPAQVHISAAQAEHAIALARAEHTNPSESSNTSHGPVSATEAKAGIALARAMHTNPSENENTGGTGHITEATAKAALDAYRAQHTNPGNSGAAHASEASAAQTHYPAGLGHADMASHGGHLDAAATHSVAGALHDASHHDIGHHGG